MIIRKNYLHIIFIICFVFIVNCSEENPSESIAAKYQGTWLWFRTVGGIFPRVITPEEGTTIKISFDGQGVFRAFRNDTLKVIAKYRVDESEHSLDKISYSEVITYDFLFNTEFEYAQIKTDTLEMWDGMIDGYFRFYKKIN